MLDTKGFPDFVDVAGKIDMGGYATRGTRRPGSDMAGLGLNYDPFWQNVVLLLRGVNIDGVKAIKDVGPRSIPVGLSGTPTVDTSIFIFNNERASIKGGVSSFVDVTLGAALGRMPGDFTFEMHLDMGGSACFAYSDVPGGYVYNGSWVQFDGTNDLSYGGDPAGGGFHHIAFSRTGNILSSLMDGTKIAQVRTSAVIDLSRMFFGYYKPNSNLFYTGNYEAIRITKNVGRYPGSGYGPLRKSFFHM